MRPLIFFQPVFFLILISSTALAVIEGGEYVKPQFIVSQTPSRVSNSEAQLVFGMVQQPKPIEEVAPENGWRTAENKTIEISHSGESDAENLAAYSIDTQPMKNAEPVVKRITAEKRDPAPQLSFRYVEPEVRALPKVLPVSAETVQLLPPKPEILDKSVWETADNRQQKERPQTLEIRKQEPLAAVYLPPIPSANSKPIVDENALTPEISLPDEESPVLTDEESPVLKKKNQPFIAALNSIKQGFASVFGKTETLFARNAHKHSEKNKKRESVNAYEQGLIAERQQDYSAAVRLYTAYIADNKIEKSEDEKVNADLAAPYYRLAVLAMNNADADKAEEYFREATTYALGNNRRVVAGDFSRFLLEQNKPKDAEVVLRNILIDYPKNKGFKLSLAKSLALQDKPIEALRYYEGITNREQAYQELAAVYRQYNRWDAARVCEAKREEYIAENSNGVYSRYSDTPETRPARPMTAQNQHPVVTPTAPQPTVRYVPTPVIVPRVSPQPEDSQSSNRLPTENKTLVGGTW